MKIRSLLQYGIKKLQKYNINNADRESFTLLKHALKISEIELIAKYNDEIEKLKKIIFINFIKQRTLQMPIAYIINTKNFFNIDFYINEYCLIPRWDSEILVQNAIDNLNERLIVNGENGHTILQVLDLCSGSGCLGLSVLQNVENINVTFLDISDQAMNVCKINARKLNLIDKSNFIVHDLFKINDIINTILINGKFDLIIVNPPYIENDNISKLEEQVKYYEPIIALAGGEDGLKFFREIVNLIDILLTNDGCLIFEIGYSQANNVVEIIQQSKNIDIAKHKIKTIKDFENQDRCIVLNKKSRL